jgi:hypothetical protein
MRVTKSMGLIVLGAATRPVLEQSCAGSRKIRRTWSTTTCVLATES